MTSSPCIPSHHCRGDIAILALAIEIDVVHVQERSFEDMEEQARV